MRLFVFFLAAFTTLNAFAFTKNDVVECDKEMGETAIAACTRMIESGRLPAGLLAGVYFYRGRAELKKGDLDGAYVDFSKSIELQPGDPVFHANRAYVRARQLLNHEKLSQAAIELALSDVNRVIGSNSNQPQDYMTRGVLKGAMGDYRGADSDLSRAIEMDPDEPILYSLRSSMRKEIGDAKGALADLEKAAELERNGPVAGSQQAANAVAGTILRDTLKDGSTGPEMVPIAAGSFLMGSPEGEEERRPSEGPQHRVTIPQAFAIGKYEVTFDEYDAFARATNRALPDDEGWGRGRRPVTNVSWRDATAYTLWLSDQTGKRYRLPSEAEWEYAARAGTQGPYSFLGFITTDKVNYDGDGAYQGSPKGQFRGKTVPVGTLPANPWGLFDVHGNLREWVQDCWNESYAGAPADGSAWQSGDCGWRVHRGGSWENYPEDVRSAMRNAQRPSFSSKTYGFRLARTL